MVAISQVDACRILTFAYPIETFKTLAIVKSTIFHLDRQMIALSNGVWWKTRNADRECDRPMILSGAQITQRF